MEQMYDTMLNAIITILSIYYMTGCSKALGVFRCQDANFIEVIDNTTGFPSMQPKKRQLAGSFRGQVTCMSRELSADNMTLTPWAYEWEWQASPPDSPITLMTP
eukprot:4938062-Prymnesium_polylepis.1